MKRILLWAAGILVVLVVAVLGWAWWRVGQIGVEKVADRLYMMTGVGGNVAVLVTDEGVVVVDTMTFTRQGDLIEEEIAAITDEPIVAIVNTHYHLDHTHGNPAFEPETKVVSTEKTRRHLLELDGEYWAESPAKELLPNDTFEGETELVVGSDRLRILHPGRGHTDGDLVVVFPEQRVIHAGDLHFNGHYPNIDLEAGGTVKHWPETIDRVLELDFDGVIPGHGPFTDRAGLERFRSFMQSLWDQTSAVAEDDGTLEDALAEVDLSEFGMEPIWFAPYLNREFVIRRAWEEATK